MLGVGRARKQSIINEEVVSLQVATEVVSLQVGCKGELINLF